MPASGFSKLALHLGRFANFQAAHQGANAFRGSAGGSTGSGAAASLSSAGAGPGAGAGGAKFQAGRGAHFTYTNTGGRAVVQAGSSSTSDGNNPFDDEEEHHNHQLLAHLSPSSRLALRSGQRKSSASRRRPSLTSHDQAGIDLSSTLTSRSMQTRFHHAFAVNEKAGASPTAEDVPTPTPAASLAGNQTAEIYRDLLDAKKRQDRVAVTTLVEAYRSLPPSEKTTAGFNVVLQAQLSVRQPGESLKEVRVTHLDMLEAGCQPNSGTSAVLVKALCARDQEKQDDTKIPAVAAEEQASSEAWRVLSTSPSGLKDITAYNALLSRCAAKGDVERALAVYGMIEDAGVRANAATYVAVLDALAGDAVLTSHGALAVEARKTSSKQVLEEAIASMRSPEWINDHHHSGSDDLVFDAYMRAAFALGTPEEAVTLFGRMLSGEDGLPAPSATVTTAVVGGFARSGDAETARCWIEKLESVVHAASAGGQEAILILPDFSDLKTQLGMPSSLSSSVEPQPTVTPEPIAAPETVVTTPSVSPSPPMSSTAPTSVHESNVSSVEIQLDAAATAPPPPSTFTPTSAAIPALGAPVLQVIDCDLGERVKSMLRARRQQRPNLDGAYRLLKQEISKQGNYAPPEVFAQLLNLYGREGRLDRVHELRADAHAAIAGLVGDPSWQQSAWVEVEDNAVSALAHGGDVDAAHDVRHAMLAAGTPPSASAYAALISSIKDTTDEALVAEQLWEESQRLGVRPNIYLVNTVISRLGRARRAEGALQLYHSLPTLGLHPTSITYGASLNCAVRVGDIATAESIFAAMEADPTFVAKPPGYNSMIQFFTYTKPDRAKALEYWRKMQARGVQPSSHTYKLLLDVHGSIEPVDADAMSETFLRLLRDHSVEVSGPHWAALISCHGSAGDLARCREIFRSIPLKTGQTADAVAYEALVQVYARHGRVDLIDWLLDEMMRLGVARTAYVANHAIEGYAAAARARAQTVPQGEGEGGEAEGLIKARTIFLAMSQPPAGVAAAGNHPRPRHHGGSGAVATANGRTSSAVSSSSSSVPTAYAAAPPGGAAGMDRRPRLPIEQVLAASAFAPAAGDQQPHSSTSSSPSVVSSGWPLEQALPMLQAAFHSVHPEPSTYMAAISMELAAGCPWNATCIIERMEERAFPPALVVKARNMLMHSSIG